VSIQNGRRSFERFESPNVNAVSGSLAMAGFATELRADKAHVAHEALGRIEV
jgi:hypothetical protein